MVLRSQESKSRDRAVVVRAGTNRRSLIHTRAANRVRPNHGAAWNIKQVYFATKPAVREIAAERATVEPSCETVQAPPNQKLARVKWITRL
jgi:hypothetical protein